MASVNSRSKGLPTPFLLPAGAREHPGELRIREFLDDAGPRSPFWPFRPSCQTRAMYSRLPPRGSFGASLMNSLIAVRSGFAGLPALDQLDAGLDERPLEFDFLVLGMGQRLLDLLVDCIRLLAGLRKTIHRSGKRVPSCSWSGAVLCSSRINSRRLGRAFCIGDTSAHLQDRSVSPGRALATRVASSLRISSAVRSAAIAAEPAAEERPQTQHRQRVCFTKSDSSISPFLTGGSFARHRKKHATMDHAIWPESAFSVDVCPGDLTSSCVLAAAVGPGNRWPHALQAKPKK